MSGGVQARSCTAYEAGTGKPLWGIDLHDDGPSSPACEDQTCVIQHGVVHDLRDRRRDR